MPAIVALGTNADGDGRSLTNANGIRARPTQFESP
jgi:hypothetical protein